MLPKCFSGSAKVMIVCFVLCLLSFSIGAFIDLSAQSLTDRANMRAQAVHSGAAQNETASVDQRRDLRQTPSSPSTPDGGRIYTPADLAYYLDASQISFIRPGLKFTIQKVSIGDDRKIQVTFLVTDDLGLPLDRLGIYTPGPVSTSFVAASIPQGAAQYVAYTTRVQTSPITGVSATQASTDSGGSYTQIGDGTYTYTFKTVLPASYDKTVTHTVSVYGSRNLTQFDLGTQYDNKIFSWVPDGSPVKVVRDVIRTNTCNSRCHDPLALHGGSRREIGLCVLCHTPQSTDPDTGNTVDLSVMVHKIHSASNLPSVKAGTPYQIIGFGQSVNDYSDVTYPYDMRACTHCHDGSGKQSNNYMTRPTAAACGSCHDDLNFKTGENHPAGAQADDKCATCHIPEGDQEWDASIKGAHTIPRFSKQLPGVVFNITGVTNTNPGQNPIVSFKITDKSGFPVEVKQMNFLNLVMAGPNTDYASMISESALGTSSSGGVVNYTFKKPIPADAKGSYTIGIEGYRSVTLNPAPPSESAAVRDVGFNQLVTIAVTDEEPVARRQVISQQACNSCHGSIALHGTIRQNVQYCQLCHNPNASDVSRRPAAQLPAESIHLKTLIHKIHTGENLSNDFTIYGFGGSLNNFNDITFPGDRRNCQKCHLAGTEQIAFPKGLLPTVSARSPISPMGPATAACLSCHDFQEAAAHASLNSSPTLGESCRVCHGPNSEFSVSRVHAR
jgi:OmcA/MtrC family decaheme c-type cytochrome